MINFLYDLLLFILFVVCVCLFALHKFDDNKIERLEDLSRRQADEITRINGKLDKLRIDLQKKNDSSDRIEIVHKYEDPGSLDFPNSKGGREQ